MVFEVTGASSGTRDSPSHIVDGKYYLGQPRFPNCQTEPCTTYYRLGEPPGSRSYQVDLGTTIGEWTMYADQSIAYRVSYGISVPAGGDADVLPPARGWDNACISCTGLAPMPRLCFPTCAEERWAAAGWTFIISLSALSLLYVALGIGIGKRCLKPPSEEPKTLLEWHPQYKGWGQSLVLVQDGMQFCWSRVSQGAGEYDLVGAGGGSGGGKDTRRSETMAAVSQKDTGEMAKKTKETKKKKKKKKTDKRESKKKGKPRPVPPPPQPVGVMLIERKDDVRANTNVHSSQQKIKIKVAKVKLPTVKAATQ